MDDWFRQIFDNDESRRFLRWFLSLIGISSVAAVSRSIITAERRSFMGFVRGLVLAIFVGAVVGGIVKSYNWAPETQGSVVGLAAFLADDLLLLMLRTMRVLRENPQAIIDYLLRR